MAQHSGSVVYSSALNIAISSAHGLPVNQALDIEAPATSQEDLSDLHLGIAISLRRLISYSETHYLRQHGLPSARGTIQKHALHLPDQIASIQLRMLQRLYHPVYLHGPMYTSCPALHAHIEASHKQAPASLTCCSGVKMPLHGPIAHLTIGSCM